MNSKTLGLKSLLKKPFVNLDYDEENKIIIARWIGFLKPDDVKLGCNELNAFIKKHNIKKHLSDHTRLKVLSAEVQAYLSKQWFAEVESLGLSKLAVLVSDDVFAQATVDNVNKATVGNLQINTYPSESQCLNWLNQG